MKAKILILHPTFNVYGGAERQIVHLCNYLTDRNYPVTLLTTEICDELRRDLKETRILSVGNWQEMSNMAQKIAHKFNIVNAHNHPTELMTIPKKVILVWQCNEPPIQILEGGDILQVEKDAVKKYVSRAVVITDFEYDRFQKIYGFAPIVNYPGVRGKFFSEKTKPKDRFGLKDKFVLLQVGMFTFTKNQVRTVEIFAEVKKKLPNAKLVLVGWDKLPYKYKVDAKINELGLQDDVLTIGYLKDDKDIRDLYNLANVHVAPVESQGGWLTTFQALCTGTPAIVSDKFVAKKLVEENDLCSIIPLSNTKQWVRDIVAIHDNPAIVKTHAKVRGEWVVKNITWDNFCEKYTKIFDDLYEDKGEIESFDY